MAKILGLIVLWTQKSQTLREWAYAGFFFNLLLAVSAHLYTGEGQLGGSLLGMIFLLTAYIFDKKLSNNKQI